MNKNISYMKLCRRIGTEILLWKFSILYLHPLLNSFINTSYFTGYHRKHILLISFAFRWRARGLETKLLAFPLCFLFILPKSSWLCIGFATCPSLSSLPVQPVYRAGPFSVSADQATMSRGSVRDGNQARYDGVRCFPQSCPLYTTRLAL